MRLAGEGGRGGGACDDEEAATHRQRFYVNPNIVLEISDYVMQK